MKYLVEFFKNDTWTAQGWRGTLEFAEDLAWEALCTHGGQWRVRCGEAVLASGSGYMPERRRPRPHIRMATWSRA